ncbi:hypothetical protein [Salinarimonas soli]|uniref:Uncharacterized protein n=1 Tax=Salinarimonas soli TaxID=1638099 RepID=A0A5B2VVF5_9HYPH|nr:hypothetical protein [Salinarimonas soli]KAA2242176.1 hypothetical protein F0L46_02485 [Salinarimonas soli]
MITGLVLVERGVEALAVTLSHLVPGVAEGLVGDAVVIARRDDEDVARVADATGAALVVIGPGDDPWTAAAGIARRDWLLCLRDGDMPADGWIRALDRFTLTASGTGLPIGRLARPWRERLPALLEGRLHGPRLRPGDLVHRSRVAEPARARVVRLPVGIVRDGG